MDDEKEPLNSSPPPLKGWHKTSVYFMGMMAFWPFSRVPPAKVHVDDEQNDDLEKNITPVRQPPASAPAALPARTRSIPLVNRIKSIKGWLVRAAKRAVDEIPEDQLQQQQKRCSKYSQKALLFAITIFVAYLGSSSASPSPGSTAFKVAMAAFFFVIPIDFISITRSPKWWGYALVYLSWFLLVLLSYLLLVSFHKDYRYAIIPVLLLFFAALLHRKLRSSIGQLNTNASTKPNQDLENIFDTAAAIVNSGGLISVILGHYMYMVGPGHHLTEVSVIGYLFFFTVVLGLYLMMAATVRNAAPTLYVGCRRAYYFLGFLLVATLIATVIDVFWLSRNGWHV